MSTLAADPDFRAVARAIFGDSVDVEELAKSLDASDVHVDAPLAAKKQKRLAAAGAGASGVALVGGLHALKATTVENGARASKYAKDAEAVPRILRRVKPATAAKLAGGAWLGLHGVELAGDTLAIRAQRRELKQPTPVAKGVKLRLRPVNPEDLLRRPSLKAVRPAGAQKVVSKTAEPVAADVEITKVGDKQQVFGWANVSTWNGQPVTDRQGDEIDIVELEKAAYDYVLDSRVGGDQHRRTPVVKFEGAPLHTADVIESMVFTPDKIEKMGLPADFPQGWWIGMQIHDPEVWELVKSGKRTGFSVHGTGRRVPLEKGVGRKVAVAGVAAGAATAGVHVARRRRAKAVAERGAQLNAQLDAIAGPPNAMGVRQLKPGGQAVLAQHVAERRRFGDPVQKADESKRAAKHQVRERVHQAVHPPAVAEHPVQSSAMSAMGYQPQTHRLSVRMNSRPDAPYQYRVKPATAEKVLSADSKGKAYTSEIRGKAKRVTPGRGYTPADRARLFAHPQPRYLTIDQARQAAS